MRTVLGHFGKKRTEKEARLVDSDVLSEVIGPSRPRPPQATRKCDYSKCEVARGE